MQRIVRIFTIALVGLLLIAAPPVNGDVGSGRVEQESKESTCEGPYKGGKAPTLDELSKILEGHLQWLDSRKKAGRRADLCGVFLPWANLSEATLYEADLSEADLTEANLSKADKCYGED